MLRKEFVKLAYFSLKAASHDDALAEAVSLFSFHGQNLMPHGLKRVLREVWTTSSPVSHNF